MRGSDRESRDAKVLRMLSEGHTLTRIGETFMLTEAGVRAIAERYGLPQRRKRRQAVVRDPPSPSEINRHNREFWSDPATLVAYGWAMAMAFRKRGE